MDPQPCLQANGTTHVTTAPHSALAAGQAISSPPAADPRDTFLPSSTSGVTRRSLASSPKMLFSDLYKSTKLPLARLRQQSQPAPADGDVDADLVSRDKAKSKAAVKKFLAARIRNDWVFTWPPADTPLQTKVVAEESLAAQESTPSKQDKPQPSEQEDLEVEEISAADDAASTYSTVSEDPGDWKARLEWQSDLSDDDAPISPSAYRFDNPDTVGETVHASALEKRAKRRRAIRKEEEWNSGLACFNARRDAWTGARTARVKLKAPSPPASPFSAARRMSFFRFGASSSPPKSPSSPLSPTATHMSGDTTAVASSDGETKEKERSPKPDSSLYPVETLLPIPPPLLPPANPMRASITPAAYGAIYDRIVLNSMTPSCPINLADVIRSCVAGWKRDGEWPPRAADAPAPVVAVRKKKRNSNAGHPQSPSMGRRMSLGFLGRRHSAADEPNGQQGRRQSAAGLPGTQGANGSNEDGDSGGNKGIRKSLQRVLGLGHERLGSNASNNGAPAG
ncbi:hypothetical protein BJ170DRAFT_46893 [Xylariales sp. AK1849]|nr:hypothetical protein BJ170DRAFT_46893 [Xylariales sp. AK1849]